VARPEVSDLTAFLLGTWRLDREILDGSRRAITGRFSGSARFALDDRGPGLLRSVEHGTLQLGSYRGPASRCLSYQVDGPCARVRLDDAFFGWVLTVVAMIALGVRALAQRFRPNGTH
jgi:hypothetical protein